MNQEQFSPPPDEEMSAHAAEAARQLLDDINPAPARQRSRRLRQLKRIGELKRELAEARNDSLHDPLTGVKNLRGLEEAYMDIIKDQHHRSSDPKVPGAGLFIDLDHFKGVNDAHGHEAGDEVLKQVAINLVGLLRASDTVGRVGGDEFMAFMPGASIEKAIEKAETLRLICEANGTTVSIGVARFTSPAASFEQFKKAADEAMYKAKHDGRNQVRLLGQPPEAPPSLTTDQLDDR